MFLIKKENKNDYPAILTEIIEKFYTVTGIECQIIENGENVECPYTNYEKCNPFCFLSLKCKDIFKKAYSYDPAAFFQKPQFLNCRHYLYYWVFAVKYNEKIFFIMTSLIRIKQNEIDIIDAFRDDPGQENFPVESIQELPYIDIRKARSYEQLLWHISNIYLESSLSSDIQDDFKNLKAPSTFETSSDFNICVISKKQQKSSVNTLDKKVNRILHAASKCDRSEAESTLDQLLSGIFQSDLSLCQSSSYAIGVMSLIGQALARSSMFYYTNDVFGLYQAFLTEVQLQTSKEDIVTCTKRFFNGYWNSMMSDTIQSASEKGSSAIIEYIQNNFMDPDLTINQIADVFHLNSSYLCRIFKADTGLTIKKYILDYRLDHATKLLLYTNNSISNIAEKSGFTTVHGFRKAFHNQYYIGPSEYRKTNQSSK